MLLIEKVNEDDIGPGTGGTQDSQLEVEIGAKRKNQIGTEKNGEEAEKEATETSIKFVVGNKRESGQSVRDLEHDVTQKQIADKKEMLPPNDQTTKCRDKDGNQNQYMKHYNK